MPALLCIMLTGIVTSLTYILCFVDVPVSSKEVLLIVVGIVCGEWKNSVGYWYQNTRSSEEKTKMLANSVPANMRRDDDPQ
jgi:hypothetical protein